MRPRTEAQKIGHRGRGQALVELAVFGAIFIMVLGAMVSYGLRYSFDLQVKQQAYRRALRIASDPNRGTASYALMVDKQIPDLTNPYGIGSNSPFITSSTVTRSTETDALFDRESPSRADLPATIMDIQTYATNSGDPATITRHIYANAGVRVERKVSQAALDAARAAASGSMGGFFDEESFLEGQGYTDAELRKYQFIYGDARRDENNPTIMTIVDGCSGEVVDHASCADQARRLVDVSYCLNLCNHTYTPVGEDAITCSQLCNATLNPPNQTNRGFDAGRGGPWYAANWTVTGGVYNFPILDRLFDYAGEGTRSMGLQQNQINEVSQDTNYQKIEDTGAITTIDDATWEETVQKTFVWHDNLRANGYERPRAALAEYTGDVMQQPIYSTYQGEIHETWRTPK